MTGRLDEILSAVTKLIALGVPIDRVWPILDWLKSIQQIDAELSEQGGRSQETSHD